MPIQGRLGSVGAAGGVVLTSGGGNGNGTAWQAEPLRNDVCLEHATRPCHVSMPSTTEEGWTWKRVGLVGAWLGHKGRTLGGQSLRDTSRVGIASTGATGTTGGGLPGMRTPRVASSCACKIPRRQCLV